MNQTGEQGGTESFDIKIGVNAIIVLELDHNEKERMKEVRKKEQIVSNQLLHTGSFGQKKI